jgi:hypothetical protein
MATFLQIPQRASNSMAHDLVADIARTILKPGIDLEERSLCTQTEIFGYNVLVGFERTRQHMAKVVYIIVETPYGAIQCGTSAFVAAAFLAGSQLGAKK